MSELAHIDFEGKRLEIVDETARKHVNKLTEGKAGYPEYGNPATAIIRREDDSYTIKKDGYVYLKVSDSGSPSFPVAVLTINGKEVVKASCMSVNTGDVRDVSIEYTSPWFPVKMGDVVTTNYCGAFERIECLFIPLRSTGESGGELEDETIYASDEITVDELEAWYNEIKAEEG